jgi:hypothetical protein
MIILFSIILVFHTLVLIQIVPYSIVWAGKLNNVTEMKKIETVSIVINLFMLLVLLIKASYIKLNVGRGIVNFLLEFSWLYLV